MNDSGAGIIAIGYVMEALRVMTGAEDREAFARVFARLRLVPPGVRANGYLATSEGPGTVCRTCHPTSDICRSTL